MGPKQKKTPSKSTDYSNDDMEMFSPVHVKESPLSTPKQGNLTGSARKLKDGAADLHNLLSKWKIVTVDGTNILSEIANIKLEHILSDPEKVQANQLPDSLLPLCDKLTDILQKMTKIVSRLSGLVDMSRGVAKLEQYNQSVSKECILFQTWDVTRFEIVFQEIAEMFQKELLVKKGVVENVCHAQDRDSVMFYSSSWVHEPYIDSQYELMLDSMLLETRHKT